MTGDREDLKHLPFLTMTEACKWLRFRDTGRGSRRRLTQYIELKEKETGRQIFLREGRDSPILTPRLIEEHLPELMQSRAQIIDAARSIEYEHLRDELAETKERLGRLEEILASMVCE